MTSTGPDAELPAGPTPLPSAAPRQVPRLAHGRRTSSPTRRSGCLVMCVGTVLVLAVMTGPAGYQHSSDVGVHGGAGVPEAVLVPWVCGRAVRRFFALACP